MHFEALKEGIICYKINDMFMTCLILICILFDFCFRMKGSLCQSDLHSILMCSCATRIVLIQHPFLKGCFNQKFLREDASSEKGPGTGASSHLETKGSSSQRSCSSPLRICFLHFFKRTYTFGHLLIYFCLFDGSTYEGFVRVLYIYFYLFSV